MNPHRKHAIWLPVLLTIVDRVITIPNWQHEANPLVTQLGPSLWVWFTVVWLLLLISVWYRWKVYLSDIGVMVILVYSAFATGVLTINVYMLTVVA